MTGKKFIWGAVIFLGIFFVLALIGRFITTQMYSATGGPATEFRQSVSDSGLGLESGESLNLSARDLSFGLSKSKGTSGQKEIGGSAVPTAAKTTQATERLIIKTGEMSLVVKDVSLALKAIQTKAEENGGHVIQANLTDPTEKARGYIQVKVPADKFEGLVADARGLAVKVSSENIRGEDVTEEYVDLQAQLKNLEATEAQFLEIMKKAFKIEDILNVQRELSQVRSEIERLKGRMQYLERNVAMSTLTINLALDEASLPIVYQDKWRPGVAAKNAFRGALSALRQLSYAIIWLAIWSIVWVPLLILFFIGWRIYRKKNKSKN